MVRRTLVGMGATILLMAAFAGQALAHPLPHLHCLTTNAPATTPGGEPIAGAVHSIARGVTLNAPHDPAFHNLHEGVHLKLFHPVTPQHPLGSLAADFLEPLQTEFTCPPS